MPPRSTIVIVTALLAALHAYIGIRLLPGLPVAASFKWAGAVWLALSFLLMPLGLLARGIRDEALGDRLAWIGLTAMGLFSSLLVLTFLRDVVLLVGAVVDELTEGFVADSAVAVVAIAAFITLAGFFNARRLAKVVDVEVPLENLPPALQGFTIAQISDIHIGPTIKGRYLERIVERVNGLDADIVAVTGDLVDGSVEQLARHTAPLAKLESKHGAYFVTGNHEYYSGAPAWVAEVQRLGLTVLMNEHVVVEHEGARVVVAGVTDYSAHHFDPAQRSDPHAAIKGAPEDAVARVLLAHQPRTAEAASAAGFDLQLSGHTHGGQFLPWNLFVPLQQPYTAGLHKLRELWIYVSRGTGYWGPPKRFGAPSEITRLKLVSA
jgi:predicted MPP superfamily phosphohydrolase